MRKGKWEADLEVGIGGKGGSGRVVEGGGGGGACCWVAHDVDDVYLHIWTGVPGVLAQLRNHPLGRGGGEKKKKKGSGREAGRPAGRQGVEEDVGVVGVVGWPHAKKFFFVSNVSAQGGGGGGGGRFNRI